MTISLAVVNVILARWLLNVPDLLLKNQAIRSTADKRTFYYFLAPFIEAAGLCLISDHFTLKTEATSTLVAGTYFGGLLWMAIALPLSLFVYSVVKIDWKLIFWWLALTASRYVVGGIVVRLLGD